MVDLREELKEMLTDIYNRGVEQGESQPDSIYEEDLEMIAIQIDEILSTVARRIPKKKDRAKKFRENGTPLPHEWSHNPDTQMFTADEAFNEAVDEIERVLE